jgi:DNA-directed RNA polymerase specialized sigma24 family protein
MRNAREIPGPVDLDPSRPFGYVFPTWREALADAQAQIATAYERRAAMFRRAHEAGLSLREIGEATGLSAMGVHKIVGKQNRVSLDDQANTSLARPAGESR